MIEDWVVRLLLPSSLGTLCFRDSLLFMVVDIPSPLNMGSCATLLLEDETQVDSTVVALRYKMGFLTLRSGVNSAPNSASTVAGRHRAVEAAAWCAGGGAVKCLLKTRYSRWWWLRWSILVLWWI